jgi:indole-3-glycerol phosphate synthase
MAFLDDLLPDIQRTIRSPAYATGVPSVAHRPPVSLRASIASADHDWALLLEHKRASPGAREPNLPRVDLDDFVRIAEAGGAAGLSCLATTPRFAGAPEDVTTLSARTRLPVLFKDFVIDPVQIDAARRAGAAAILLIARLETEGRLSLPLAELADRAHAAGLEVVLEFHAAEELAVADHVRADVYGINLRDLDSLRFRPDVVAETFGRAGGLRPLIGMSGIEGPEDAARFRRWGADGVLVGTALARSSDPAGFVAAVRRVGSMPRGGS